jgi:hypothetical protein
VDDDELKMNWRGVTRREKDDEFQPRTNEGQAKLMGARQTVIGGVKYFKLKFLARALGGSIIEKWRRRAWK